MEKLHHMIFCLRNLKRTIIRAKSPTLVHRLVSKIGFRDLQESGPLLTSMPSVKVLNFNIITTRYVNYSQLKGYMQ